MIIDVKLFRIEERCVAAMNQSVNRLTNANIVSTLIAVTWPIIASSIHKLS